MPYATSTRIGNGPWTNVKRTKKTYKPKSAAKPKRKPYVKRIVKSTKPAYKKPIRDTTQYKTNDKHFDEKIAKSQAILGQISKGMDVAAKPIKGIINLAELYAGRLFSFFKKKPQPGYRLVEELAEPMD